MAILRQAHRKKYTCIDNSLAQNHNLTLGAKGMMLYLLSLPDDWKVHINHLSKVMIEGREAITTILKELKKEGYIHHQKLGFKEGWQYFVFETPTTEEEFKEFLRTIRVSQQLGKPNSSGLPPLIESNNSSTKENKKNITKDLPSAEASDVFEYFVKKLKERLPTAKEPDKNKWINEIDRMMRCDNRTKEQCFEMIDWIELSQNSWYRKTISSPTSFRKYFDKITLDKKESLPDQIKSFNRNYALQMKEKYPEHLKKMSFDKYGVSNPENGKDVSFSMNHEEFKEIFIHIFGGQRS